MKEFICVLKQTVKVTRYSIWSAVIPPLCGTVLGGIGTWILYCTEGVWCGMEVPMALGMMAAFLVPCCFIVVPIDFIQALAMGKTRKYLFPAHYVLWLRNTLVGMLCLSGICLVKDYVYSHFVDGFVMIKDEWSVLSNPLIFVTIVLCVPALILFLGGMRLFFGIKLLWGVLGLCMILIRFSKLKEKYPDFAVLKWLGTSGGEPNVVLICLLCLLCGVIMLGLSWLVLRKQRVVC